MTIMSSTSNPHCEAVIEGLRAEFGPMLAQRIMEAEEADLLWESRVRERYLGQHLDSFVEDESSAEDISRMAFVSFLDRRWHAGICLVDGEGAPVDLEWKMTFENAEDAESALLQAR